MSIQPRAEPVEARVPARCNPPFDRLRASGAWNFAAPSLSARPQRSPAALWAWSVRRQRGFAIT
jgi:hypothetical protein